MDISSDKLAKDLDMATERNLKGETESLLIAAQNITIRIKICLSENRYVKE